MLTYTINYREGKTSSMEWIIIAQILDGRTSLELRVGKWLTILETTSQVGGGNGLSVDLRPLEARQLSLQFLAHELSCIARVPE